MMHVSDDLTPIVLAQSLQMRDFLVSPGFGGALAVIAAIIVFGAVLYLSRRAGKRFQEDIEQRERHRKEARDDEQHAAAIQRCWDRLTWLVETAGIEPTASEGATVGLGPELALGLLWGLRRDAEDLGDDTLANAVTVYQNQFALVLAQQGGPLSELAGGSAAGNAKPDKGSAGPRPGLRPGRPDKPEPQRDRAPVTSESGPDRAPVTSEDKPPSPAADETPAATAEVGGGERRRRR